VRQAPHPKDTRSILPSLPLPRPGDPRPSPQRSGPGRHRRQPAWTAPSPGPPGSAHRQGWLARWPRRRSLLPLAHARAGQASAPGGRRLRQAAPCPPSLSGDRLAPFPQKGPPAALGAGARDPPGTCRFNGGWLPCIVGHRRPPWRRRPPYAWGAGAATLTRGAAAHAARGRRRPGCAAAGRDVRRSRGRVVARPPRPGALRLALALAPPDQDQLLAVSPRSAPLQGCAPRSSAGAGRFLASAVHHRKTLWAGAPGRGSTTQRHGYVVCAQR
jgi:hypothetical protein